MTYAKRPDMEVAGRSSFSAKDYHDTPPMQTSIEARAKLPPVDQPPNHHRGLLLKLNTAASFVRAPNLDPKPDHHDLSRIKFVVLVVENGEFLTQIEGGEVHCRTPLSFREIATDRFSVLAKSQID
ncbi:hypothetical protein COP2_024007 [Malus domestica]